MGKGKLQNVDVNVSVIQGRNHVASRRKMIEYFLGKDGENGNVKIFRICLNEKIEAC